MKLYDKLITGRPNSQLIREGWLLRTRVFSPSEPDIRGVTISSKREYNQEELGVAVQECTVFADVFREWERWQDRQTILFAPRLVYARSLTEQFNERLGPGTAAIIEGATQKHEREKLFAAFNEGRIRILTSVDVLKEGFDCNASCGIDLQPNAQLRTFIQKVGRVRRQRHTHDAAIWLDLAGNYWRHPHPDEDIDWHAVNQDTTPADVTQRQVANKKDATGAFECPKCGLIPQRWRGGECPGCGHELHRRKRLIRMGNGRTEEMQPRKKQTRLKTHAEKVWDSCLFPMARSPKNLKVSQLCWLFDKKGKGLPIPERHREACERRDELIRDVFPWATGNATNPKET